MASTASIRQLSSLDIKVNMSRSGRKLAGLRAIAAQRHRPPLERPPPGRRTGPSQRELRERDQLSCHAKSQGATGPPGTRFSALQYHNLSYYKNLG